MKHLGILLGCLLLLSGCSQIAITTGVVIKNQTLKANQCTATLPIKKIGKDFEAGTIDIARTLYVTDTGDVFVHERGTLDTNYEFSTINTHLMNAGFEFKRSKVIDAGRYHDLIEGLDRNGNPIYVLSGMVGVNDFEIFYSHKADLIKLLLPCVKQDIPSTMTISAIGPFPSVDNIEQYIVTDWGPRMLFLYDVVERRYLHFHLQKQRFHLLHP